MRAPPERDLYLYRNALVSHRYRYFWNHRDVPELYDLSTDPGELENPSGAPACKEAEESLKMRLFGFFERYSIRFSERRAE